MSTTNNSELRMTISLSDERLGQQVLRCLAESEDHDSEITVHSMSQAADRPSMVQVATITETQWEAAKLAVEMGYYDVPRRVSLGDLASELGISKSAVSQRLSNLERAIITNLVAQKR